MGPGGFCPTNPDLADILGDMDFDFENSYFLDFLDFKFPDFQFPDFQISRNLAWGGGRSDQIPKWLHHLHAKVTSFMEAA